MKPTPKDLYPLSDELRAYIRKCVYNHIDAERTRFNNSKPVYHCANPKIFKGLDVPVLCAGMYGGFPKCRRSEDTRPTVHPA